MFFFIEDYKRYIIYIHIYEKLISNYLILQQKMLFPNSFAQIQFFCKDNPISTVDNLQLSSIKINTEKKYKIYENKWSARKTELKYAKLHKDLSTPMGRDRIIENGNTYSVIKKYFFGIKEKKFELLNNKAISTLDINKIILYSTIKNLKKQYLLFLFGLFILESLVSQTVYLLFVKKTIAAFDIKKKAVIGYKISVRAFRRDYFIIKYLLLYAPRNKGFVGFQQSRYLQRFHSGTIDKIYLFPDVACDLDIWNNYYLFLAYSLSFNIISYKTNNIGLLLYLSHFGFFFPGLLKVF